MSASELSESFNTLKSFDSSTSCLTLTDITLQESGDNPFNNICENSNTMVSSNVGPSVSNEADLDSDGSMESVDIGELSSHDTTILEDEINALELDIKSENISNNCNDATEEDRIENNDSELDPSSLSNLNQLWRSNSVQYSGNPFIDRPTGLKFNLASGMPVIDILSPSSSEEVPIVDLPQPSKLTRHQSLDASSHSLTNRHHPINLNRKLSTAFDDLLHEIYDRWHYRARDSFDSDTFTDLTESDAFQGRSDCHYLEKNDQTRLHEANLLNKSIEELKEMQRELLQRSSLISSSLVKQLKRRNRLLAMLHNNSDVITAVLQASSLKRSVDSKIKFSIEPLPGDDAFNQWRDAMRAVARLPSGIPAEFRKKVWLALADNYLSSLHIDWEKTKKFAFNEKSNPDDIKLDVQIVKDLHRTGCSGFSGHDNEEERAVLKRVLLAYARWNKQVGYCQGFNVLAALILDVMERKEDCALKVMIFLIDKVLPEGYFANNLRALSVDMAVFRELLQAQHPTLSGHLTQLQTAARDYSTGANYEPPLTNVFTMQWFLTIFATCVSKATALRIWDSVLLEGSEILLRTAISIWGTMQEPILSIDSADEFYTSMGVLSQELMDRTNMDADKLLKTVYDMAPFPFPQLTELREKYTYNITPFSPIGISRASMTGNNSNNNNSKRRPANQKAGRVDGRGQGAGLSDDEMDDDDMIDNINCFTGMFPSSPSNNKRETDRDASSAELSKVSPGAYTAHPELIIPSNPAHSERITLDIDMLSKKYSRLKQRQKQAHIIFAAVNSRSQRGPSSTTTHSRGPEGLSFPMVCPPIESPVAVNHLFLGRDMLENTNARNRTVVRGPTIATRYYDNRSTNRLSSKNESTLTTSAVKSLNDIGQGDPVMLGGEILRRSVSSETSSNLSVVSDESTVSLGSNFDTNSESSVEITFSGRDMEEDTSNDTSIDTNNETLERVEGVRESESSATLSGECVESYSSQGEGDEVNHPDNPLRKTSLDSDIIKQNGVDDKLEQKSPQRLKQYVSESDSFDSRTQNYQDSSARVPKSPANRAIKPNIQPVSSFKLVVESWCAARDARKAAERTPGYPNVNEDEETNHRAFNPFPTQYINHRRTKHGLQLGLYSSENMTRVDSPSRRASLGSRPSRPPSDRAKRDACVHRQYLAEISSARNANY